MVLQDDVLAYTKGRRRRNVSSCVAHLAMAISERVDPEYPEL